MNVGENIFSGTVIMSTYLWEELKVTFLTQSKKKKKKLTQLPTCKLNMKLAIWEIRSTPRV